VAPPRVQAVLAPEIDAGKAAPAAEHSRADCADVKGKSNVGARPRRLRTVSEAGDLRLPTDGAGLLALGAGSASWLRPLFRIYRGPDPSPLPTDPGHGCRMTAHSPSRKACVLDHAQSSCASSLNSSLLPAAFPLAPCARFAFLSALPSPRYSSSPGHTARAIPNIVLALHSICIITASVARAASF
jgi:hypothetical protein